MRYSVQSSEVAGFIYFISKATPEERQVWLKKYPELKEKDFENFAKSMEKSGMRNLFDFIEQCKDINGLCHALDSYPRKDLNINEIKERFKSIWPIYHQFYQKQIRKLNTITESADTFMNNHAQKPLEKVARFYGLSEDYTIPVYTIPVATKSTLKQCGGWCHKKGPTFVWLGSYYLEGKPKIHNPIIFHEASHMIFHNSKSLDSLFLRHWVNDSPVVQCFENNPLLKRDQKQSGRDAAFWILDEGITTAFQGIFEEDILHQKRKNLYADTVINVVAHKMMPILREAIKTGETFGPEFLKKFEMEFLAAVPEMLALKKKEKALSSRISNGSKDGKDDPRNETKASRTNTRKKTVFPSWLKNPSWLWHRKQK